MFKKHPEDVLHPFKCKISFGCSLDVLWTIYLIKKESIFNVEKTKEVNRET